MVPDLPSPSRRGLIAGAGLALAGATVGVGATDPTVLPDPLTDRASKWLPDPTDHRWHPPVGEAHARDAVRRLAEEVERGRGLWDELDTDERFGGAGGWLESARESLGEGNYREATVYATGGMQLAAEEVGIALHRLDRPEADPNRLAERGAAIRERADRLAADIDEYRVAEPGRDLGWYHEIERRLRLVRLDAHKPDSDRDHEYDDREVGSIRAGNRQATQRVRDAEHYREQLRDLVGDGGEPWADRIERIDARFRAAIEEFPSRGDLREEVEAVEDDHGPGPYYTARWKLAMEPCGPRSFDSGHVVREKRAGEDIDVAEVGFAGSYERPIWGDCVDAYCYALIGRMKLTEYPRVYERFVGEE